jgi:P-type Ca2+ transporter type 2C
MSGNPVTIVNDGKLINIDEENLCKNDVVVLQVGDVVPADLILIESSGLEIDEFDITGEIMPVVKKVDDQDVNIYMGSMVIRGLGKGLVVATGEQTEYGKVLMQEWERDQSYPFHFINARYLWLIGLLFPALFVHLRISDNAIAVVALYLILSVALVFLQNDYLLYYLLLSSELKEFRSSQIQIRDPKVFELLNELDIVCFDKTGVLTSRQMDINSIYFVDGMIDASGKLNELIPAPIIKMACALCHDVIYYEKTDLANPVDKAIIAFAIKNGTDVHELLSQNKRIYDKPFNSEERYMACGFEIENQDSVYFAKGDPGVIMGKCRQYMTMNGTSKKLDWRFFSQINACIDAIDQNGGTAIALAYATVNGASPIEYTFLCLLQLENLLQPGAREIIKGLKENGIRSLLLTGDRAETAIRVSEASGITINSKACLTGRMINTMESSEITRQSAYCSVFARLTPSQKGYLIRLLQQKNHHIAMVGDGANDGIALKVADIGISFGSDSSLIARRLSKIHINDLADLMRLVEGSHRLKMRDENLRAYRSLLIVAIFIGLYISVWILAPQLFPNL